VADHFIDPGGNFAEVREIWALIAVHAPGNESLAGIQEESGWLPLIVARADRLGHLRELARKMARQGKVMRIVRFSERSDVATFHPDGRRTGPGGDG